MREVWGRVPVCDILVSHGPPYGILDAVSHVVSGDPVVERVGDRSLRAWTSTHSPELVVFGHIHAGHGQKRIGKTLFCNASMLDEAYNLVYDVTIIDL